MDAARHVVLVGLMGSGKTSIGKVIAERSGRELLDSDALLEDRTGATAAEIAAGEGIDALHRLEAEVLRDALRRPTSSVIAAPASVADDPGAGTLLADHHVIWTTADPAVLADRVRDPGHRPVVGDSPEAVLREQAARRSGRYRALADVIVDSGVLSPEQAATSALREGPGRGG